MNPRDALSGRPVQIAVAVVRQGDHYLIGQRQTGKPLAGMWEFPGGKVVPGELPSAAASRECLEETGLAVRVLGLNSDAFYRYDHATVTLSFFDCEAVDPQQVPKHPFRWVPAGDLAKYTFPPANAALVSRLLNPRTRSDSPTSGP
jgi:mutator protein MutT